MPMADVFTPDAFELQTLTGVINKVPYLPGLISRRGLFQEEGVATNTVSLEEVEGVISLVQTQPRGGVPKAPTRERRKLRSFNIPHLPVHDYVMAAEVQGVREFGSESALQTIETVRNQRLTRMAGRLDVTLERHRVGAIKGIVLDADDAELFNLYTEFGVSAHTVKDMDLDNASPASGILRKNCAAVTRTIADELGGAEATGFEAICGDAFFDDLIAHQEVRQTYQYQQGAMLREAYAWQQVDFGGIRWINYRNGGFSMINTDRAHVYPLGVPGLFITRYGPADYTETVNTIGLPRYAKAVVDPWGKRVDMEAQTNPLNLCTRPRALYELKRT